MNQIQHNQQENPEVEMAKAGEAAMLNVYRHGLDQQRMVDIGNDQVELATPENRSVAALERTVKDQLLTKMEPKLKDLEAKAVAAETASIMGTEDTSNEHFDISSAKKEMYELIDDIVEVIVEMRMAMDSTDAVGVAEDDAEFRTTTVNALGGEGDLNLIVENKATADKLREKIMKKHLNVDKVSQWKEQAGNSGTVFENHDLNMRIVVLIRDRNTSNEPVHTAPEAAAAMTENPDAQAQRSSHEGNEPFVTGTNSGQVGQPASLPGDAKGLFE